jgi:hypothetical protein
MKKHRRRNSSQYSVKMWSHNNRKWWWTVQLRHGTMAEVTSICANPKCGKTTKWFSQPYMTGTMIPAGNFLLSFGILVVGTSATKVLRVFQHMGLKCISLSTFFKHQRVSVAINIYLTICLLFYPNSRWFYLSVVNYCKLMGLLTWIVRYKVPREFCSVL